MISTFDLSKLNSLLKDFYNITRIRITVFDDSFRELTAYPEHIAPCCQIIRNDPRAAAQCARCDAGSRLEKPTSTKFPPRITAAALQNISGICA